MERDYGLISKFVKEDEKREKKPEKSSLSAQIEALRKFAEKFKLPEKIKLDIDSEKNDSLKFKEGMREDRDKKKMLEKYIK